MYKGIGIQDFEMQVFDRWGSVIFQSDNLEYGWDGTSFSGKKMNNGTYMYHIYLTDVNGKP
ncbi:MAG: T9SS type B sorting domain-containing protein [Flavobacteriales bacterium]|nr:T9SS type B sorting domain-containing protein [Flavobacteriales bacterium]MBT6013784.1 T9SS type B sorting domain-containing protein [Flavobacteriales bacterium]MBT7480994.1 T9SS type B sorting domain-containing protein [Flavobacteriales bacterium]